jgi:UDP-N-acetylmuramoylalanine--D-glutamate ligase
VKVAILGYGVEGKSAERYLKLHEPSAELTVFKDLADITKLNLEDFDMVVRSPSVNPHGLRSDSSKVTSGTQIFFDKCPAPIIGVTGTKGKGTTCSLIASILRAAGYTVHLVGNIGVPALSELDKVKPSDLVVYELSSFQLWGLSKSPKVAVVLRIEPDHLDVHDGFNDYIKAKENIVANQTAGDLVVYYAGNKISAQIAQKSLAKKLAYPSEKGAKIEGHNLLFSEQIICSTDTLKLPGAHNLENALAAVSAIYNMPNIDSGAIEKGLSSFTGLPHRLELVCEQGGVKYYDDSYSSATPATEVAVRAFSGPVVLIAGGYDRGLDYTELGQFLSSCKNLKKALLIGQTKDKIAAGLVPGLAEKFNSLELAVRRAHEIATAGDTVVLSPGCASFDMFENFSDRGEQFQKLVKELHGEV